MMYPLVFIFVYHRMANNSIIGRLTFALAPRLLPSKHRNIVFLPIKVSNLSPLPFPICEFLKKGSN